MRIHRHLDAAAGEAEGRRCVHSRRRGIKGFGNGKERANETRLTTAK